MVYFGLFAIAIIINKAHLRKESRRGTQAAPNNQNEIVISPQDIKAGNEADINACKPSVADQPLFCHNEHYSNAQRLTAEEKQKERTELKSLLEQGFIEKDEYNEKLNHLR